MLISKDPLLTTFTLPNGLQVYIKPNHYPKKRVYMELFVRVGAQNEDPSINGISHFIEHMAFKTTEHFNNGDVFEHMKEAGVAQGSHANAYTGFGRTVYHFQTPSDIETVRKGLTFLGEFAGHMRFLPEEVEVERKVILEELRRAQDKDYTYFTSLLPKMFVGQENGHNSVLGSKETLESFTPEILENYYRTWYRPDNMALIIVGDIDVTEAQSLIEEIFSPLSQPTNPLPEQDSPLPEYSADNYCSIFRHEDYVEAYMGLLFPEKYIHNHTEEGRKQHFVEMLSSWILDERLQDLIQSDPLIESMYSSYDTVNFHPIQILYLNGFSHVEGASKMLELLLNELKTLATYGVTLEEIETSREKLLNLHESLLQEMDKITHSKIAREIQYAHLAGNIYFALEDEIAWANSAVQSLTPEDFLPVLQELYSLETRPLISFALPEQDAPLTTENIHAIYEEVKNSTPKPPEHQEVKAFTYTHLSPAGSVPTPVENIDFEGSSFTMGNGCRAYYHNTSFEKDTIHGVLVSKGGQLWETQDTPGLSEAFERAYPRGGTLHHSFREIQKILHPKKIGLSFERWGSLGYLFSFSCAPKHFEEALQIVHSFLHEPGFRDHDSAIAISELAHNLKQQETTKEYELEKQLSSLLYSGLPYGNTASFESISSTSVESLKKHFEKSFAPESMELAFVGAVDKVNVPELVHTYFSGLPQKNVEDLPSFDNFSLPATPHKKVFHKGADEKALIQIAYPGLDPLHPEHYALEIYTTILTELLEKEIREKRGGTYSIYAMNSTSNFIPAASTMEIYFECDPNRTEELRASVDDVLSNAPTLITEGHVTRAQKPLKTWLEEEQDRNSYYLRSARYRALNRPLNWLSQFVDGCLNVTHQDIVNMAKNYHPTKKVANEVWVLPKV